MTIDLPYVELFLPKLKEARDKDSKLDLACGKIDSKLKEYLEGCGIHPDRVQLFDVCDADGELHPKLRTYIESIPRLKKQTDQRHKKYKEEVSANIQRAIDSVIFLITGTERIRPSDRVNEERSIFLNQDHPVLNELYPLLPRRQAKSVDNGRLEVSRKITGNGCLFYLSCVEALKHCKASSLHDLLAEHRPILSKSFKIICLSSPEKLSSLDTVMHNLCRKFKIKTPPKNKRPPVDGWPSPLREEMQVYQAAVEGSLMLGLEEKIARSEIKIKIRKKLRPATVKGAETLIGTLLLRYFPGCKTLGVSDLLATTKTKVIGADGNESFLYCNSFLSPYRESERARADNFKGAGFDSCTFKKTCDTLLNLAAYNGIFDHHIIIREAFKLKFDVIRIEQRKADKKNNIERGALNSWIEDNWEKYERILTQELFKRDKNQRSHLESDRNMRFVLFYSRLVTMKVMGYRQRQLRDCSYGENLILTKNSVEFTYPADKMKILKRVHFKGDLESCNRTHGRLIHTLWLYYKFAFDYIQANLNPWPSNDEKLDPRKQFFVLLDKNGKFNRFHPDISNSFTGVFKRDCYRFLKHPDLKAEAALLNHPHHMRGVAMDLMIEDNGMPIEAACKYFAVSRPVMDGKYRDKAAPQDASREIMLVNMSLDELEHRKRRNQGLGLEEGPGINADGVRELKKQLSESSQREKQYLEREKQYLERDREKDHMIASFQRQLERMQEKHHEELLAAHS